MKYSLYPSYGGEREDPSYQGKGRGKNKIPALLIPASAAGEEREALPS